MVAIPLIKKVQFEFISSKQEHKGGGMAELVARPLTVLKVRGSHHGAD
jgi:hypothetical protein